MVVLLSVVLTLALQPRFDASVQELPPPVREQLTRSGAWHTRCPTSFSDLRLLTVSHWGFDRRAHTGRLVVSRRDAHGLATVFHRLWRLHFPIHHMRLADSYGPGRAPRDRDVSISFDCTPPVPSPCDPGGGAGGWSEHAYGEAVDLNPIENPYTCGGRVYEHASRPYLDRSRLRRGMVTPGVVSAFRSIGWGYGGTWAGSTRDYTHFSASGH
jgi:hypothetical protein